MADEITLTVGGRNLRGWTSMRLTRGIERLPSDFELTMTELAPGDPISLPVKPGDSCKVSLGEDLVITGFVDRLRPRISPTEHVIGVVGRGKCSDLVDCSAEWPRAQLRNLNAFQIAQKLALPYQNGDLKVKCEKTIIAALPRDIVMNIMLGETPWEIIERVARYSSLLAYDTPDGNLLLTRVNETEMHASGFEEGVNIQTGSADISIDQRFSEYLSYMVSFDTAIEIGGPMSPESRSLDKTVLRHRRKIVIAESPGSDQAVKIARQRADWEKARRYGRSFVVTVTADSWRDKGGKLWTPNTLAPIDLPSLKLARKNTEGMKWTVAQVTYSLNEETGTTASVTLMPAEAFKILPVVITPVQGDIEAGAALRVPP